MAPRHERQCSYIYPRKNYDHAGERCEKPVHSKELCATHYVQDYRGRLGKTHEESTEGVGDQITFHINSTLKARAEKAANKIKVSLGEYLRRLIDIDTTR